MELEINGTSETEEVLKDASMVQTAGTPAQPTQEPPASTPAVEVNPLEQAMREFNKAKQANTETTLPTEPPEEEEPGGTPQDTSGGQPPVEPDASAAQPDSPVATEPTAATTSESSGGISGEPGGPTTEFETYDAQAGVAEVRQELVAITQDAVRKEFAKQGKNKISVNDLMKVNEQSGTKEFINPDTNRPFTSSNPRSEAAAYARDFNEGLDAEFAQECQKLYPQVEGSYKPMIEFRQFLPRWQQMDEFRQNMFEELVQGHELRDRSGQIAGYNVDLNAIADQMERQIQWLLKQQQAVSGTPAQPATAPTENPVTQPAVAAKTSGGQSPAAAKEEKQYDLSNLADSLAYYNKQKKQKGQQ